MEYFQQMKSSNLSIQLLVQAYRRDLKASAIINIKNPKKNNNKNPW